MSEGVLLNRNILDYHQEAKDLDTFIKYQNDQVKNMRRNLLATSRHLMDMYCQHTLKSGFFLRMSPMNVVSTVQLPFMKPDGISVAERLIELPGVGSLRSDIAKFVKSIFNVIPLLPKMLANLKSDQLSENMPFIPSGVKGKEFLACSTLPSLFGYCWSSELKIGYITFVCQIAANLSEHTFSNFRDHWLMNCFKNIIQTAEISKFLKFSVSSIILRLIRDEETAKHILSKQDSLAIPKLIEYAREIVDSMLVNINHFPTELSYLFSQFISTAETEDQKLQRFELLFFDCFLIPAVSLPKSYGILPPTFFFELDQNGPSRSLQTLAQVFRFALRPSHVTRRYPDINPDSFTQIRIHDLYQAIVNRKETTKSFVSAEKITNYLGLHYLSFLFSMCDVCFLSFIARKVSTGTDRNEIEFLSNANKIPVDESVLFHFFRVDHWSPALYNVTLGKKTDPKIPSSPNIPEASLAKSLFKLLVSIPEDADAPVNIESFMNFHNDRLGLRRDGNQQLSISHFCGQDGYQQIFPYLEEEFRRNRELSNQLSILITTLVSIQKEVDAEFERIKRLSDSSNIVLYQQLLSYALQNSETIEVNLKNQKQDILMQRGVFKKYFDQSMAEIAGKLPPNMEYTLTGVGRAFHSWIMARLTLTEYKKYHKVYQRCDTLLIDLGDKLIEDLCISPAPGRSRRLLDIPEIFAYVQDALEAAMIVEVPLEALDYIVEAINLILDIYRLEYNESPQADELAPIISYCIISKGFKNLFSFGKFMDHFLGALPQGKANIINDSQAVALTHFVNHISSLDSVLSAY